MQIKILYYEVYLPLHIRCSITCVSFIERLATINLYYSHCTFKLSTHKHKQSDLFQASSQDAPGPSPVGPSRSKNENKTKKNRTVGAALKDPSSNLPSSNPVPVVGSPNGHLNPIVDEEDDDFGVELLPGLTNGHDLDEPGPSSNPGLSSAVFKVPSVQSTSRKPSKRK